MSKYPAIQAQQISKNLYWVGALDWELRNFHGYNTSRGTTYNAYLITGEHPTLIDTVRAPFFDEMMARIESIIPAHKIEYIVSNHAEMDHSGALQQAIAAINPKQVFASKNGVTALQEHFHWNQEITAIEDQQILDLGDHKLQFFESKMLHWPDSMFSYLVNEGILFSQDMFGMHLATDKFFTDENETTTVHYEAAKYFANIMLPYSNFSSKMLAQIDPLQLNMIAPDHGPIWRSKENCHNIIHHWQNWSEQKSYPKIVIIYDTMWDSTAKMARAIAAGAKDSSIEVKLLSLSTAHRSDVATEILEAGALLIGTPILNQQIFPTLADVITYLKGLKRQNLIGQYFGSYGWAASPFKNLAQEMQEMKIEMIGEPVLSKYVPDATILDNCKKLGQLVAEKLTK